MFKRSKYKKTLIPRWERDVYRLTIGFLSVTLLIGIINKKVEAYLWTHRSPIISPLGDTPVEYVVEEIEVPVTRVPESPEEIIRAVFKEDAELAIKVARCESNLNAKAKNKDSSARGLFQILSITHNIDERFLFNPLINTLVAKQLYDEQGWIPWESSKHCWSN